MLIRKLIFDILCYSGISYIIFFVNRLQGKIPIILFHRVSPNPDPCWPPLTPTEFERTIKFLSGYYKFYSLNQILDQNEKIKSNACSIVFDDGFLDFKLHAFPVLDKYNIPVTLFIPTDNINHNRPIWTSEIDSIVKATDIKMDKYIFQIGNKSVQLKLKTHRQLFQTAYEIKNLMLVVEPLERNRYIQKLRADLKIENEESHPMLSWEDINVMKAERPDLLNIQSHSHSHPYLPSLDKDAMNKELKESAQILNAKKNNPCTEIAYPIGGYNTKTLELVKKYYSFGYKVGNESLVLKKLNSHSEYKYEIPRFNIHTSHPEETFLFVNGFHGFLTSIIGKRK